MLSRLFRREKADSNHSSAPAVPSNRYTVLVVDDDAHLRELLKAALEHNGYAVRVGETGADAVRLARETTPDLIVLDGNMPVMDGFDALKRLRTVRSTEKIPIIMLTMRSHQVDMLTGYRFGAQEYLTKPVVVEQLLVSVRRLLSAR
jgi:two-component system alkaline phosphatase synthesis response regulator PhoP